jgi:hypothetical protein
MADVYLICAAIGGTVCVVQLLLSFFGLGHHDVGSGGGGHGVSAGAHHAHDNHDDQASYFLGLLSFRAIVAAVTFFGLAGFAANKNGVFGLAAGAIAVGTGFAAMSGMAWAINFLNKLQSDGTARIEQSIGATGSVYLTIPEKKSGAGKISAAVQGRTMEYLAVTAGQSLAMGSKIVIVDIVGPDTVQVEAVPPSEELPANDGMLDKPETLGAQKMDRNRGSDPG